jgi:hypothetical protein
LQKRMSSMAIPDINLSHFIEGASPLQGAEPEDILETGNVQRVRQYLNTLSVDTDDASKRVKLSLLLSAICQTRASNKAFSLQCNRMFTKEYFQVIKSDNAAARIANDIIARGGYEECREFHREVEVTAYLSKPRFSNGRSLFSTRFSHHLSQNLGRLRVMSKGAAYVGVGVSLIATSLLQFSASTSDQTNPHRNINASVLLVAGFGFVSAPFFDAYVKSKDNTP